MRELLRKLRCWIGRHDTKVKYWSAPTEMLIDHQLYIVPCKIEAARCCRRIFATYKDWPRIECADRPGNPVALGIRSRSAFAIN